MENARHRDLLRTVFECQACPESWGFTRGRAGGPYLKFPPTIGARGRADLLFVGINPRLSGNRAWMQRMIKDYSEFEALAGNLKDGKRYICPGAAEPHYQVHLRIVREVYGAGANFEEHAAVTELFFCSTVNTDGDFPKGGSECADEYLRDVLAQVQPKAIICVGKRVLDYMQTKFSDERNLLVYIPHPGNDKVDDEERESGIQHAVRRISSKISCSFR